MASPTAKTASLEDLNSMYSMLSSCPVLEVPIDSGRSGYLVTGYDAARGALADPGMSTELAHHIALQPSLSGLHPAYARNMLHSNPPRHTRLRRLAAKAFTARTVERLRPYIQDVTDRLVGAFRPHGRADLVEALAVPLPVAVICELLGVPEADRPRVRQWSDDLVAAGEPERLTTASHEITRYMAGLIDAKRNAPDAGLLTDLIGVSDGGDQLDDQGLVSLAVLLLVAGHETTTNAISNSVLALLRHPGALSCLREDPTRIEAALDELLRYDAPVSAAAFRHTTAPVTVHGATIPAGESVLVSLWTANRDPARFPEPDVLDLDRDAQGHLAFGHGIHRCLGAPLARAELTIALTTLLTRCPGLELATTEDALRWEIGPCQRRLQSLPVRFSPGG
ncbi:cytochrome P450 [Streptomyces capparidis]